MRAGPPASKAPRHEHGRALARVLFNIAIFGVSIWFLWSVLRDTGFEAVGRRLLEATPWLVAVTAAANLARYMLLGLRWEILVRTEAPMGYRPILSILMAGNFLQLVAPGFARSTSPRRPAGPAPASTAPSSPIRRRTSPSSSWPWP